jgi:DNA-binding transcriptional LysR family regulator
MKNGNENIIRRATNVTGSLKTVNERINVPSFDAICRMVQCGLGVGLIPDRAFEVIASGMGINAIPLTDDWAHRELKIVTRDPLGLSTVTKMLVEHLAQFGRPREGLAAETAKISI